MAQSLPMVLFNLAKIVERSIHYYKIGDRVYIQINIIYI